MEKIPGNPAVMVKIPILRMKMPQRIAPVGVGRKISTGPKVSTKDVGTQSEAANGGKKGYLPLGRTVGAEGAGELVLRSRSIIRQRVDFYLRGPAPVLVRRTETYAPPGDSEEGKRDDPDPPEEGMGVNGGKGDDTDPPEEGMGLKRMKMNDPDPPEEGMDAEENGRSGPEEKNGSAPKKNGAEDDSSGEMCARRY